MKRLCTLLGACTSLVIAVSCRSLAGPTGGVEAQPGPGRAVITGDPTRATETLVIRYMDSAGDVSGASQEIAAGEVIEASTWTIPGTHRLVVNDEVCVGSFDIVSEHLTEVTLRIGATGCESAVTGIRPLPAG